MDPQPGGSVKTRLALLALAAVTACSDRSVTTLSPPPTAARAAAAATTASVVKVTGTQGN